MPFDPVRRSAFDNWISCDADFITALYYINARLQKKGKSMDVFSGCSMFCSNQSVIDIQICSYWRDGVEINHSSYGIFSAFIRGGSIDGVHYTNYLGAAI